MEAVKDWPVRRCNFLGFANFYRKFIRNFGTVASPLHDLTSFHRPFAWTPQAGSSRNSSPDSLLHPSSLAQTLIDSFMVEVNASDVGVGAVLAQRLASDGKLHP